jgi:hypothetical protein
MSDKDYHEGYFEGVRAALLAYMHFQEEGINNPFHKWLKEAKELRDNE